jgi:3-oxoacyl-[acyl-carrier protein] reductase
LLILTEKFDSRIAIVTGADIFFTHWSHYDETDGCGAVYDFPNKLCDALSHVSVRSARMEVGLADSVIPQQILEQVKMI